MLAYDRFLRQLAAFSLALPLAAAAATPITGVVTNRTTNKPAAGDTVTLLELAQGMQEAGSTTTDSHGHFKLDVNSDGVHLIRVTHDKASYFKPAPPGTTDPIDIDVYNAAPKVKGVATEAVVMRIQTDASGHGLTVVENIFVKNDSKPPMTQFSASPFDFYLPTDAVVVGSAALAPGGMPVQAAPVPLSEKGHYTFLFPIRPGETRFQVSYNLPYSGSYTFTSKLSGPTDTVAVMMPKAMSFKPASGSPFSPVEDDANAQTLVARNVTTDSALSFTVSGSGQLPRDTGAEGTQSGSGGPAAGNGAAGPAAGAPDAGQAATTDNRPGMGLGNPLDPNADREPLSKYKWWILGGLGLVLAAVAGFLLRKPAGVTTQVTAAPVASWPPPPVTATVAAPLGANAHQQQLLQALKEELFLLETDRLQNRLSESEYAEQKTALELVLRRALNRSTGTGAA
ncbi:MAG: carboxypeptidase regulatory-like domain-containing protein [Acidobacteriota bacterium]